MSKIEVTVYSKFIVAALGVLGNAIGHAFTTSETEVVVSLIIAAITAIGVFMVPNKKPAA